MEIISLKEQLSLAKKLHLENGKCPVCDSKVNHLNPLFQEDHLAVEQNNIKKKIVSLENQNEMYEKKKQEFSNVFQQIIEDETTLRAHSINDIEEIDALKNEISLQKINIQKIPSNINSGLLVEVGSIDSHSKLLYEKIMELENETSNFDENSFSALRNSLDDKQLELSETDQKLGGIDRKSVV